MAVKITRGFEIDGDRYAYDFKILASWAQVDTGQDASYFGTWACPVKLAIFNYCEGDTTLTQCETIEEFRQELQKIKDWNNEHGHRFLGVDPGLAPERIAAWVDRGLADFFHQSQLAEVA